MGKAVKWALIGELIGVVASAVLSGPEILLWSTVAMLITAIAGS
jgi:hypothetical protein